MLNIEIKNGNIEKALSLFKYKTNKTKQNKILRDRQDFKKPSITKRLKMQKAKYIQRKNDSQQENL